MRPTVKTLRDRIPRRGEGNWLRTVIRRFRVAATSGAQWVLEGFIDGDGNTETEKAEVFGGIGFYSRPKADHRAEVIVAKVGGESGHPVIVATRDHDAVKALLDAEGDEADIVVLFNSQSFIRVKADGTVEIGSIGGSRAALATKADIDALASHIDQHRHDAPQASAGSLPTSIPTTTTAGTLSGMAQSSPAAAGTQKLEAE